MLLISSISLGTDDYGVSLGEVNVYAEEVFDGDGNLLGLKLTVKAEGLQEGYNLDLNGVFLDYDKETGNNKLSVDGEKANSLTGTSDEDGKILWDVAESLGSTVGGSDGITTNLEGTAFFAGLSLADIDGHAIGIRATSTGFDSEGSLKLVGEVVVPPPTVDNFEPWGDELPAISHVTFYFNTGKDPYYEGDTSGLLGPQGKNDPDGWFTVKFDVESEDADKIFTNDMDDWFAAALAFIEEEYPDLDLNTLEGVSIKGGTTELWYALDGDPTPNTGEEPDVWIVENREVDAEHTVTSTEEDVFLFV